MNFSQFKKTIWDYYKSRKRELPWRHVDDPYKILVSEVMLQQTQVVRVYKKYESFLFKFPTIQALAKAPLKEVLKEWQGLGYNRRALHLKKAAEEIVSKHRGIFPKDRESLMALPGIGQSTAGALLAFAWNKPAVFIETNIRSVFIHFFFKKSTQIADKKLLPLIEKAVMDEKNSREWYYALMDYGVMLKTIENPSRKSKHHVKQSAFKGSRRQKRSWILRHLLTTGTGTPKNTAKILKLTDEETFRIMDTMTKEGVLSRNKNSYTVSK